MLRTCTQVLLKNVALDLNGQGVDRLLTSPIFYTCIVLYLGQVVAWIGVLRTTPLSIAYPFTSLTVVTILLSGVFLFGEPLDLGHVLGSLVIMAGLTILMRK